MKGLGFAKITPPSVEGVYERVGLYEQLTQNRHFPVIWISASAGSGKTTFLASYLKATGTVGIWYKLDEGDADLSSFFYYLGMAVQQSVSIDQAMPLLTPDYLAGLKTFVRNYFRRLYQLPVPPAMLVLDNYQDLPADAALHELLAMVLEEAPPDFNIVVLSRNPPPADYSRLLANRLMIVLDRKLLALSPHETEQVCRLYDPALDARQIEAIQETTRGWFAGITLLLQKGHVLSMGSFALRDETIQGVFDYFASEVFGSSDSKVQHFLMQLALLPEIHPRVARELTGQTEAEQLLADLYRRNYFITLHQGERAGYEFHPLFRQFLLTRLHHNLDREQLRDLQRQAAGHLASNGQPEAAMTLWRDAADWPALIAAIGTEAPALLAQGRHRTLETWINYLPEEMRRDNAWIMYWLGVCRFPFAPAVARSILQRAYQLFAGQDDSTGELLAWSGVVDCYVYGWADMQPLDEWIAVMQSRLRTKLDRANPEIRARVICSLFTALMYRQPKHPELPEWMDQVRAIVDNGHDARMRLYVGTQLLLYDTWWAGDLSRARLLIETLEPLASAPDVEPLVCITWHMMSAAFFWMTAENSRAIAAADAGLELANSSGVHALDVMLNNQALFATLSSGDLSRAEHYFANVAQSISPERYLDNAVYHHLRAWYFVLKASLADARRHVEESLKQAEQAGSPWFRAHARNACATILHLTGDQSAVELLRKTREADLSLDSGTFEYLSWLAEAELLLDAEEHSEGLQALEKSMQAAIRYGFVNHTWWRPQVMARIYARALVNDISVDYVRSQIRQRRLLPDGLNEDELEAWPWEVEIYTLGRFEVIRNAIPLQFSGKAQKKPLELLKALIALGGQNVSTMNLGEILWPDAEGDVAQQNLKATLHRLRKLIGHDAVLLQDSQMGLNPDLCWTDIGALRYRLKRLEQPGTADLPQALARLLDIYRGPFLANEEAGWVIVPREMLHGRFLQAAGRIAAELRRQGDIQPALRAYYRLLELEPLQEDLYLEIMQCYRALGQPQDAAQVYRQLQKILNSQAGQEPSTDARMLYRTIAKEQM